MDNNKYQDKPQNVETNVSLIDVETYKKPYDSADQILQILSEITWDLIQIPIQCSRAIIMDDPTYKGYTTVGRVKSYDPISKSFMVEIFGKYYDTLNACEDLVIFPRTSKMEDTTQIASLLIGPTSSFEYITKISVNPVRGNNNRNNNNRGRRW